MNITIDYYEKIATVTGAVHPNGQKYVLKGIKKRLQEQAKEDGLYGLEFWHYQSGCGALDHRDWKNHHIPGTMCFEILDMYGRL